MLRRFLVLVLMILRVVVVDMCSMIIRRITLENIRSYDNLDLVIPEGIVLLSGDIGSGKTTVLLAIEFALFGLQPGQRGSSLLRNGCDRGSVVLELSVDDIPVRIVRGLVVKGKSISQSDTSITIDGVSEDLSSSELKNRVLTLLNYPPEFARKTNLLYKFTVYTPQEEMKQIILEDSQTRLNAIRHVFGMNKYKTIRENASLFITHLREIIRNHEGMIRSLDSKKQNLEERKEVLIILDKELESAESEYNSLVSIRKSTEKELSDTK
ncbi:hypothetical protein COU61_05120, partial [Candidatus Pacearchaeota archaeon CG10_big_fil_rev_8_21_14_0_10_35_13]